MSADATKRCQAFLGLDDSLEGGAVRFATFRYGLADGFPKEVLAKLRRLLTALLSVAGGVRMCPVEFPVCV